MRKHFSDRFHFGAQILSPPAVDGPPPADPTLDSLELRDAILGEGIVMHETPDGGFEIHLVLAGGVQRLGWFADAAAAWRALDDIDRHPDEWSTATPGHAQDVEHTLQ